MNFIFHDANGKAAIDVGTDTYGATINEGTTLTSTNTLIAEQFEAFKGKVAEYTTIVGFYSDSALTTAITAVDSNVTTIYIAVSKTYSLTFTGETNGDITTTVTRGIFKMVALENDKKMNIGGSTNTINGTSYTKTLKLSGTMNADSRYVEIDLSGFVGKVTITVDAKHASSSGDARTLQLLKTAPKTGDLVGSQSLAANSTGTLQVINLNGGEKYYLGSAGSGINIFGIYVTPVAA